MSLPAGPARVRASDRDRERVVQFIRTQWHEGRLTDAELDQRVGRALQARTLGDLRKLYDDLPVPEATAPQRARRGADYVGRALKTVRGIVVAVGCTGVVLAIIGAIVGPQETEQQATGTGATQVAPTATATPEVPAPEPKVTTVDMGERAEDGNVECQVRRIRSTDSVPRRADRGGDLLAAGQNRKFFVADVRVVNKGSTPEDPFCGSGGAALQVAAGEAVEPIEDLYQLQGNETMCSGGLQPEAAATVKLVFRVPEGDEAEWLDVWNSDEEGDILGKTRLRVRT
jgi:Domain of unknown function (DUF1707)